MNKGKNSKPYGEKMQSNLENLKFFKQNQKSWNWWYPFRKFTHFNDSK